MAQKNNNFINQILSTPGKKKMKKEMRKEKTELVCLIHSVYFYSIARVVQHEERVCGRRNLSKLSKALNILWIYAV